MDGDYGRIKMGFQAEAGWPDNCQRQVQREVFDLLGSNARMQISIFVNMYTTVRADA